MIRYTYLRNVSIGRTGGPITGTYKVCANITVGGRCGRGTVQKDNCQKYVHTKSHETKRPYTFFRQEDGSPGWRRVAGGCSALSEINIWTFATPIIISRLNRDQIESNPSTRVMT